MPVTSTSGNRCYAVSCARFRETNVIFSLFSLFRCDFLSTLLNRFIFGIDTIQDKLPPLIHHGRLNDFIVGDPCVYLQDQHQS
jgi:hypothetical protein